MVETWVLKFGLPEALLSVRQPGHGCRDENEFKVGISWRCESVWWKKKNRNWRKPFRSGNRGSIHSYSERNRQNISLALLSKTFLCYARVWLYLIGCVRQMTVHMGWGHMNEFSGAALLQSHGFGNFHYLHIFLLRHFIFYSTMVFFFFGRHLELLTLWQYDARLPMSPVGHFLSCTPDSPVYVTVRYTDDGGKKFAKRMSSNKFALNLTTFLVYNTARIALFHFPFAA